MASSLGEGAWDLLWPMAPQAHCSSFPAVFLPGSRALPNRQVLKHCGWDHWDSPGLSPQLRKSAPSLRLISHSITKIHHLCMLWLLKIPSHNPGAAEVDGRGFLPVLSPSWFWAPALLPVRASACMQGYVRVHVCVSVMRAPPGCWGAVCLCCLQCFSTPPHFPGEFTPRLKLFPRSLSEYLLVCFIYIYIFWPVSLGKMIMEFLFPWQNWIPNLVLQESFFKKKKKDHLNTTQDWLDKLSELATHKGFKINFENRAFFSKF